MPDPPFLPDVDLVLALAKHIEQMDMRYPPPLVAFDILRALWDLGIDLPVRQFDGKDAP